MLNDQQFNFYNYCIGVTIKTIMKQLVLPQPENRKSYGCHSTQLVTFKIVCVTKYCISIVLITIFNKKKILCKKIVDFAMHPHNRP